MMAKSVSSSPKSRHALRSLERGNPSPKRKQQPAFRIPAEACASYPTTRYQSASSGLDLLDALDHCHGRDEGEPRKHLVRLECRVENTPRDAHRGECLHHLEVAGSRCAREAQTFEIDEERDATGD